METDMLATIAQGRIPLRANSLPWKYGRQIYFDWKGIRNTSEELYLR